jgi:hypothetical protein
MVTFLKTDTVVDNFPLVPPPPLSYTHTHTHTQSFIYYRTPLHPSTAWLIFAVTGISLGAGTTVGVIVLFLAQVRLLY